MHRLALNAARARASTRKSVLQCPKRRDLSHSTQTPKPHGRPENNPGPTRSTVNPAAPQASSSSTERLPSLDSVIVPPQNFSQPTVSSLNFWYRFLKFSLIGLSTLTVGTLIAFEGSHFWVEHVSLAPEPDADGELARWGWDKEAERWTGGKRGGTDKALGWKAKHALRSAWAAAHWGTGTGVLSTNAIAHAQSSDGAVEARLEYTHDFLNVALPLAIEKQQEGKPLRRETVNEILMRHAATLERIGSKGTLYDARADYERVWEATTMSKEGDREDTARLALKLGDVNARLGDVEEARVWWSQALSLSSDSSSTTEMPTPKLDLQPALPTALPPSPHAQRTLLSTLSSLSAHYAHSGLLADAHTIQDAALALLSPSDPAPQTDSAPHALHTLFLAHRASLLTLHRAEVAHARRTASSTQTFEELTHAASAAERVARLLSSASTPTGVGMAGLDGKYASSRTLAAPASSLLRDARRTALHAWTLAGVLHENAASSSSSPSSLLPSPAKSKSIWRKLSSPSTPQPPPSPPTAEETASHRAALQCYERALGCAGVSPAALSSISEADGEELRADAAVDVLAGEWRALWGGYSRSREALLKGAQAGAEKETEEK